MLKGKKDTYGHGMGELFSFMYVIKQKVQKKVLISLNFFFPGVIFL